MKRFLRAIVMLALVIGGSYWYGYQKGQQDKTTTIPTNNPVANADQTPTPTTSDQKTSDQPTSSQTDNQSTTTSSQPDSVGGDNTVLHQVEAGETLYTIGLKYNILWTTIASANNITDKTPLKEGQVLIIPVGPDGTVTKKETLQVDQNDAQNTQNHVDNGDLTWRKDPVAVVRQSTPVEYHLKNDDTFTLTNYDQAAGQATVVVDHDNQVITIDLVQPVTKGDNGVWYITTISTQNKGS